MQVRLSHLSNLQTRNCGPRRYGFRCRFLGAHLRNNDTGTPELVKNEERMAYAATACVEANRLSNHAQKLLRTKKVLVDLYSWY
jgi:tRNA-dihydrouridine synthase 3